MRIALLTAIVIFAAAESALAQIPIKNEGDPNAYCQVSSGLEAALKTSGPYLPGAIIFIRADPLQMWTKTPVSAFPRLCKATVRDVPKGNWSWQIIERPSNSTSQLGGTSETTVSLLLERPGVYRIRFVACAFGCEIAVPNYGTVWINQRVAEIVIRVQGRLPPAKSPVVPVYDPLDQTTEDFKPTDPTRITTYCQTGQDKWRATWYTVLPWNGASDYKLLEGKVVKSIVSSSDSFLNHRSNDWDMGVEPHPWSRWLLGLEQPNIAVEWERQYFPEKARPTEDDWISAFGYWIYDCDHNKTTEIHPPVLLATQRARAIRLPENSDAGSNVYVPGIVTDIWMNERAGDITGACATTGLHDVPTNPLVDRCLPDSGEDSPNPIKRIYKFNIYLPRSPQALMADRGKTAPPVPLFIDGCGSPAVCEIATAGGVTYLKVTIDLTNYDQPTYEGRIIAGWEHAAPDNWGAKRWDVRITSLDVSDDGDTWSDGDWRFWVNTNNGESEWAKIFDCADCVHGKETFDGKPWATNASDHNNLGPSIVLFPNQPIWVATRGFESERFDDTISSLSLSLNQSEIRNGQVVADDGTGKYTMYYQVLPGPEIGRAQLSRAALERYNAYFLTDGVLGGTHGPLEGVFDAGFGRSTRSPVLDVKDNSEAIRSIMVMSVPELRQMIKRAKREKRNLNGFFRDLKRVLQRPKGSDGKAHACEFLANLKLAISGSLWRKHGLNAELCVPNKTK